MTARTVRRLALSALALLALAAPAHGQENVREQLRESELRLQQIRRERQELQQAMERLRSQVHDVSAELANIERQVEMSADALRELDFQSAALSASVDAITRRLLRTRDRLAERKAVLHYRLRSIYKRGPLHAVRVLFGAESFGDLLNRYKYLRLVATYDRLLVQEVERLARELTSQERELKQNLAQLQSLKAEKLEAFAELQVLEDQQKRTLASVRERERRTQGRLEQLRRDEQQLTRLMARLERERREAERRRAVAGRPRTEGAITTRDLGSLDWPVEGRLVYRFGPERRPNGVRLRWNGIGIAAEAGTPVRAVEAGTVVMAGPFEGYGPTVIVSHGGGYYTSYHYLRSIRVEERDTITAGQVIGTVGGEHTPEGPHVEFQVRAPVEGGFPEPVDPLTWLRNRSSR